MEYGELLEIGFEEKEAKIYTTLLKRGNSAASTVAEELGYDRTTTYYVLMKMVEKGYASHIIKHGAKTFNATQPKRILQVLQEKTERFKEISKSLEKLWSQQKQDFVVEVRQGLQGMRHLFRDAVDKGDEILSLGSDDAQYLDFDETGLQQYYRDAEAKELKERIITYRGAKLYGSHITQYRYINKDHFQPTPICIYANTVVLICWSPTLYLIFIQNQEIASGFKKHFEMLWKISDKK
ncbi:TrmB family transcriptional regulator [Candidatus Woesearchaeota archaeon]|nr:MAG: TrmB family transcriptional regulator [Candidatus Woesearchaeota archaeon]